MRSKWKVVRRILMCMMILGLFVPQSVNAADQMDKEREVSLRIEYQGEKESLSGVGVWIYKVADVNADLEFELTGDFAKYPVKVNGLDAEGYRLLAETLETYVLKDGIKAYDKTTVNENGVAEFPATKEVMEQGLYLVISQKYIDENQNFTYAPILICLPNRDVDGNWVYDETIYPKDAPEDEKTSIKVVKIWKGNDDKRPEKIEVELLKDGKVFDTVILNEENNWRYEWKLLEKGNWKVAEKDVPEGYTVIVSEEQTGYVIINTYEEPPTTPPTPPTPPTTPPGKNPQTGVLWWPVPILAGVGMVLFMIGWVKRRRYEG